jgi:hypothetical protein
MGKKIAGLHPPLSSFPCLGTQGTKGSPYTGLFPIMPALLSLSKHPQDDDENLVLANTKVRTRDMGQPLQKALLYLS